jgi:hypothetical protein
MWDLEQVPSPFYALCKALRKCFALYLKAPPNMEDPFCEKEKERDLPHTEAFIVGHYPTLHLFRT